MQSINLIQCDYCHSVEEFLKIDSNSMSWPKIIQFVQHCRETESAPDGYRHIKLTMSPELEASFPKQYKTEVQTITVIIDSASKNNYGEGIHVCISPQATLSIGLYEPHQE